MRHRFTSLMCGVREVHPLRPFSACVAKALLYFYLFTLSCICLPQPWVIWAQKPMPRLPCPQRTTKKSISQLCSKIKFRQTVYQWRLVLSFFFDAFLPFCEPSPPFWRDILSPLGVFCICCGWQPLVMRSHTLVPPACRSFLLFYCCACSIHPSPVGRPVAKRYVLCVCRCLVGRFALSTLSLLLFLSCNACCLQYCVQKAGSFLKWAS